MLSNARSAAGTAPPPPTTLAKTTTEGGWPHQPLCCHVAGNDDNDENDGNNDRIARKDQIDGGRHGPHAPWGRIVTTATLACHGFDVVVVAKWSNAPTRQHTHLCSWLRTEGRQSQQHLSCRRRRRRPWQGLPWPPRCRRQQWRRRLQGHPLSD